MPAGLSLRGLKAADLDLVFEHPYRVLGREWLSRHERGEVYIAVACLEGVPVARSGLDFVRIRHPQSAYLWAAQVAPPFQSRGIGSALFHHLEDVARTRGLEQVYLAVAKTNFRAQSLYEHLGYRVYDQQVLTWSYLDDEGRPVDVAEDSWLLIKSLE